MKVCDSPSRTADGSLIARCSRCGRVLYVEPYRSAGIGPICAEKLGVRVLGADPEAVSYGQYARKAPKPRHSTSRRKSKLPLQRLSHHPVEDDAEQLDLFDIGSSIEASREAKE